MGLTAAHFALDRFRVAVVAPTARLGATAQRKAIDRHVGSLGEKKARTLYEALNPAPNVTWNLVAKAFAIEAHFSAETREYALRQLAATAGIKTVVIRKHGTANTRGTGKGRPPSKSRAVPSRKARAKGRGRATSKRGQTARERACDKWYSEASSPAWHQQLFTDLKTTDDVLASFKDFVPEGGEERLFARLCGGQNAFGRWFRDPNNIREQDRKAALDWLANQMGLKPKRRVRLVRAIGNRRTTLRAIKPVPAVAKTARELAKPMTEAELTENVKLRKLKRARDQVAKHPTLSIWYLAIFVHGDPSIIPDATSTGGSMQLPAPESVAALMDGNTSDWMTEAGFNRTAKKFGKSSAAFKRLIGAYERQFEAVVQTFVANMFRRRMAELFMWQAHFTHDGYAAALSRDAPTTAALPPSRGGQFYEILDLSDLKKLEKTYRFAVSSGFSTQKLSRILRKGNSSREAELKAYVLADIASRRVELESAWAEIKKSRRIYDLDQSFRDQFIKLLRIDEDSTGVGVAIIRHASGPAKLTDAILTTASLLLSLIPGGLVVRLALIGIAAWQASNELQLFKLEKALVDLQLLPEHRSYLWVILAFADIGFEASGGMRAAYKFFKKAPSAATSSGNALKVAEALLPHAPDAKARDAIAQVIRAQRSVEAAESAALAARKELRKGVSPAALGLDLPPIPTGLNRKNLLKLAVLEVQRGNRSLELVWARLRANAAFRALPLSKRKAFVKALSSRARRIVRRSGTLSSNAKTLLRKRLLKGKRFRRFMEFIDKGMKDAWNEMIALASSSLATFKEAKLMLASSTRRLRDAGARKMRGLLSRMKGHLQELLYRGMPFHRIRETLANRLVKKLNTPKAGMWQPAEFVTEVFEKGGALTDGMWISRSKDGKQIVLLDIYEAKSAKNWRALYRKQFAKDVRRLDATIVIEGRRFGPADVRFAPDAIPGQPQRFAAILPTEMKRGVRIDQKLVERSEKALGKVRIETEVSLAHSPLTNDHAHELAEQLLEAAAEAEAAQALHEARTRR